MSGGGGAGKGGKNFDLPNKDIAGSASCFILYFKKQACHMLSWGSVVSHVSSTLFCEGLKV